ncbi:MAG: hypothetical protein SGARI_003259 [Bacillariaceae sp.]
MTKTEDSAPPPAGAKNAAQDSTTTTATTTAGGETTATSTSAATATSSLTSGAPGVNNSSNSNTSSSEEAAVSTKNVAVKSEPSATAANVVAPAAVPYVQPGEEVLQLQDIVGVAGGGMDADESTSATASVGSSSNNKPTKKSRKNSAARARFPDKLHRLLDDCSHNAQLAPIVSWMGQRAFKVHQPKQFAAQILPQYFATTTYKSFQRNLNLWYFVLF